MEPHERGDESGVIVTRVILYAAASSIILFAAVMWLVFLA